MAIRAFRDDFTKRLRGKGGLASQGWVLRTMQNVLGKLHFTGAVKQAADGHIHIEGGGDGGSGDECVFPFRVTIESQQDGSLKVLVQPGYVKPEGGIPVMPRILGAALDRYPNPPSLEVARWTLGNRHVFARIDYTPVLDIYQFGSASIRAITGCRIDGQVDILLLSYLPSPAPAAINFPEGAAGSGTAYLHIASITAAGNISQNWWGNAYLVQEGDGRITFNAGA